MSSTFWEDNLANRHQNFDVHIPFHNTFFWNLYQRETLVKCTKYVFRDYHHCTVYIVKYLKWPTCLPTGHG